MKPIALIGKEGRMATALQELLHKEKRDFICLEKSDLSQMDAAERFQNCSGCIDFSVPQATKQIAHLCSLAKIPYVCGTTGWEDENERDAQFAASSQVIPIVWDSNFSLGIEVLCQSAEVIARSLNQDFFITDLHHQHKKDAPSGTALKIAERIQEANKNVSVFFRDIRAGELPGEHRVFIAWGAESLEFNHRAYSRFIFAEGSLRALDWAQKQKPGFYRLRNVLNS